MKKLALATLLGLLLLAGSLGLFPGNSDEAEPDPNLPVIQNVKAIDFKTGMNTPGKDEVPNKEAIMAKAASLAVPFVKNAGQFDSQVQFAADLFGGRFFLTDKELVYSLIKHSGKKNAQPDKHVRKVEPEKNMSAKGLAFHECFIDKNGAKIDFKSAGEEQAATKVSYFKGNDPSKWRSGVSSYQSVSLGQVYHGIEVKLKASGKNVEKIFSISPQTDVDQIKIGVAGVNGLEVTADGRLLLKNSLGELAMRAPVAWQEIDGKRSEVKVGYRLLGKKFYGFAVLGDFNKNHTLVIDPDLDTLLASTFLGGSSYEYGISLALDSLGNVYLSGPTYSSDFPTTAGAYDREINPESLIDESYLLPSDVFISKLNSDLNTVLASTYLGGTQWDIAYSLALDNSGNVYLTGSTTSADFPTTFGAYSREHKGSTYDAFVAKLDGNLSFLLTSTYLGGHDFDTAEAIALDPAGNVYLTGSTTSVDFPTTPGAYDRTYNAYSEVFISKFDGNLTELLASSYLGGGNDDFGRSLALDTSGNVFITGGTVSPNFPITPGVYDPIFNVGSRLDVFISKLDGDLTRLLASTFLGGSKWNGVHRLALDNAANVVVIGQTDSIDFPTTPGAYDRTYNGGYEDIFISKLDSNLTTLLASTYLGGSRYDDWVRPLVLDNTNNVYLAGYTCSTDFPTTTGAYDRTYNGGYGDIFISKLDSNLTTLLASTFLGGSEVEDCYSLALDSSGNVYLTGGTSSTEFPTTIGAYDRTYHGGDVFIAKLNGSLPDITLTVASPNGGERWIEDSIHYITWNSNASITNFSIDYSINSGINWIQVATNTAGNKLYPLTSTISGTKTNSASAFESNGNLLPETAGTANTHSFAWTIPPTPSTSCLVRISDAAHATTSDTSDAVFTILMNLDLQVERHEVKSFSIMKQYGQIQIMITHPDVPVAEYRIMRRKNSEDFVLLKTVTPSELQNNQFQMQDKYLEKGTTYTYQVEAYNASSQLVGISSKKTI